MLDSVGVDICSFLGDYENAMMIANILFLINKTEEPLN